MSKLSSDAKIMDWFRQKGQLIIEGNKEYYIIIEYTGGKYQYRFGDSVTNQDTEVKEMQEIELLEYLKAHFVRKAKVLKKLTLRSSDEVWTFIQENPYV